MASGFLVKLALHGDNLDMDIIPYFQSFDGPGARRMDKKEELEFRRILGERSKLILDAEFVQKKRPEFCLSRQSVYLSLLRGHSRILKRLNSQFGFAKRFYSGRGIAALLNVIRCQIHQEALETILDRHYRERNLTAQKTDGTSLSPSLNKGEEAILLGMLKSFNILGDVKVSIFSSDHVNDRQRYSQCGVDVIDSRNICPKRLARWRSLIGLCKFALLHMAFAALFRLSSPRATKFVKGNVCRTYCESDIVILGHDNAFSPLYHGIYLFF